jgi:acyl-CoA dehydrogenase
MEFATSARAKAYQEQVHKFLEEHLYPAEPTYLKQVGTSAASATLP